MRRVLVVGRDSLLGAALSARLNRSGYEVAATTRRDPAAPGTLHLDLADPAAWPPLQAGIAVLCAAQTSVAACEDDPESTHRINVDAPAELIARLAASGSFIVLPSTTMVFDGERSGRTPDDPPSPHTAYGRQKAELEARLREIAPERHAIVRIGKVVSREVPLWRGWIDALERGEPIRAFTDLAISPVALEAVATLLERIVTRPLCGTVHFTATGDVTYYEAAVELANALGALPSLVAGEPRTQNLTYQRYASLDSSSARDLYGMEIPDPREAIRSL